MTATKREGQWLNSYDNPYSKQYDLLQPTLMKKNLEKKNRLDKVRMKITKKSKAELMPSIPFNTHANRSFDKAKKSVAPGPGSYIDVNDPKYSSVLHKQISYGNSQSEGLKKISPTV